MMAPNRRPLEDTKGRMLPIQEVPAPDQLKAYGDLTFLAMRSPRHRDMTLGQLHQAFEPPVTLGQYRVFLVDDVPRGGYLWASLSLDAERRMIEGGALSADDWTSGRRLWIVDFLAPYRGVAKGMARWIMVPGNFTERSFRFRRVVGDRTTRKIVHIDFRRRRLAHLYNQDSYIKHVFGS